MLRSLKFIISFCFFIFFMPLNLIKRLLKGNIQPEAIILYYHSIPAGQQKRFAQHMKILKRWSVPLALDAIPPLKAGTRYSAVTFDDGFLSVVKNALPILIREKIPAVLFIPAGCLGTQPLWGIYKNSGIKEQIVSAKEIEQIASNPSIAIGSHGLSHKNLALMPQDELHKELFDSRRILETAARKSVILLSFPHGAYNDEVVRLAGEAGYVRSFSILPLPAGLTPAEKVTGRIEVTPADWNLEFFLKLAGAYQWLPRAFTVKHRIYSMMKNLTSNSSPLQKEQQSNHGTQPGK